MVSKESKYKPTHVCPTCGATGEKLFPSQVLACNSTKHIKTKLMVPIVPADDESPA